MTASESIAQFAAMMRLGTEALRNLIGNDPSTDSDFDIDVDRLFFLIDRIEEVVETMKSKAKPDRGASD